MRFCIKEFYNAIFTTICCTMMCCYVTSWFAKTESYLHFTFNCFRHGTGLSQWRFLKHKANSVFGVVYHKTLPLLHIVSSTFVNISLSKTQLRQAHSRDGHSEQIPTTGCLWLTTGFHATLNKFTYSCYLKME